MKVCWETRKILDSPEILISCTAVRIPILRAHSEAITIETELPITANEVRELLASAPGVKVVDDPKNNLYPRPKTATRQWDVEAGRIRENNVFGEFGLDLFVSGDQVKRHLSGSLGIILFMYCEIISMLLLCLNSCSVVRL
jgi:aspartate-semialdehyde dehydrogenase